MPAWAEAVNSLAEQSGFASVVSVDRGGEMEFGQAYGLAHRGFQVANTFDTRFGIASGTKGLTALANEYGHTDGDHASSRTDPDNGERLTGIYGSEDWGFQFLRARPSPHQGRNPAHCVR